MREQLRAETMTARAAQAAREIRDGRDTIASMGIPASAPVQANPWGAAIASAVNRLASTATAAITNTVSSVSAILSAIQPRNDAISFGGTPYSYTAMETAQSRVALALETSGPESTAVPGRNNIRFSMDADRASSATEAAAEIGERLSNFSPRITGVRLFSAPVRLTVDPDVRTRSMAFHVVPDYNHIIVSGYGDPVGLLQEAAQSATRSQRSRAVAAARRMHRGHAELDVFTISISNDTRWVVILGDDSGPRTARSGRPATGALCVMSRDAESVAYSTRWGASSSDITTALGRALQDIRASQT
jgi:hypothetical protein